MTSCIKAICNINGLTYENHRMVSGGDINAAFAVNTMRGSYFLKLNSASKYPLMFQRETEGLAVLQKASLLKVPKVIATGERETHQYLLLELLQKAAPSGDFWDQFAGGLAQLHRYNHTYSGWHSSNYIGSLVQQNNFNASWSEFYATQRIIPLVKTLLNRGALEMKDVKAAEKLCNNFQHIFPNESPALLHGDLWSGNFMAVKFNNAIVPSVYDPAVYFGHREMDIGMSLLFGGFNARFYNVYNNIFPLEKNWQKRVSLTQLYPLLVHAVLFGGAYISRCRSIVQEWS